MNRRGGWNERSAWITVVAVLATSMLWLTVLSGIALAGAHGVPPVAAAVLRALARVFVALAARAWPVLPAIVLGGMMLAVVARAVSSLIRKVRHA